jgi:peptidyl-prolyl cis-trans isomerase SurA
MGIGEISKPVVITGNNGADTYRILYLKSRTEPHKANLKDDYNKIMQLAEQEKKEAILADWVSRKVKKTYVYIKDEYLDCDLMQKWINK